MLNEHYYILCINIFCNLSDVNMFYTAYVLYYTYIGCLNPIFFLKIVNFIKKIFFQIHVFTCSLFLYSAVWSLAGSLSEKGREVMDNFIREQESSYPSEETVYEYFIDQKTRSFVHWQEKLSDNWKYDPEYVLT